MAVPQLSADSTMASIRAAAPRLLQRVQQGLSNFELAYVPHAHWPLPHPKLAGILRTSSLRISVLDSSFNPPTLAHLHLANSSYPSQLGNNTEDAYTAKLLLLSVKNADKTLKPGDARHEQRLEMMYLLVKHMNALYDLAGQTPSSSTYDNQSQEEAANTAIGIIDEPTFVGKSHILRTFLEKHLATLASPMPLMDDVELTFLVGHDTLERLFAPRYYSSEEAMHTALRQFLSLDAKSGDHSRIVSAKRTMPLSANSSLSQDVESIPHVHEYLDSGRIAVIDMGDTLSTYSSTTVRHSVGSLGQVDGSESSWRRLLTKDIADYIVQEGLYKTDL